LTDPKTQTGEAKAAKTGTPPNVPLALNWGLKVFGWMASSPRRFSAAQRLAGIFSSPLARQTGWLRLPAISGWGYSRDFPKPASQTFQERFRNSHKPTGLSNPAANQGSGMGITPKTSPVTPSETFRLKQTSLDERIARFRMELELLEGTWISCPKEELVDRTIQLLEEMNCQKMMTWQKEYLPEGLLEAITRKGISTYQQPDPEIKFGLTGAIAAAAETATILLPGGPGRPLTVSLLPEVHIAILEAEKIHQSLSEIIHLPQVRESSSVAFISGPSRTADIEMTLTIGVHGPGKLIVICVT
jgi:L-lactate dehydrogenase complex protein LldG